MHKCTSMAVDTAGNIWTIKDETVIMLSAVDGYKPVKMQTDLITTPTQVVVSKNTTYVLTSDRFVNRLSNKTWQKLPGRLASTLTVNENEELFIIDDSQIYKMNGQFPISNFTDPIKCYVNKTLMEQQNMTDVIKSKIMNFEIASVIGYDTKERLESKCEMAYVLAFDEMKKTNVLV